MVKRDARFVAGLVLTILSGLMLAAAAIALLPRGYVDFPCMDVQEGSCLKESDLRAGPGESAVDPGEARLFLCISVYPRGFRGGGTIARGLHAAGTWTSDDLVLEREGEILVVNGEALAPGEFYRGFRATPSLNPWLLRTVARRITHRGVFDCLADGENNRQAADVVYAYGYVSEGWLPNPMGLAVLGIGIWLLVARRRAAKKQAKD